MTSLNAADFTDGDLKEQTLVIFIHKCATHFQISWVLQLLSRKEKEKVCIQKQHACLAIEQCYCQHP